MRATPNNIVGAWACGLSRDGSELAVGSFGSGTPKVVLFDTDTGIQLGKVNLVSSPVTRNVYTIEYR